MELTSDLEFYCFLKMSLPAGFSIAVDPPAGYFTEWFFCYTVYWGSVLFRRIEGDFRSIIPGTLIHSASAILADCERACQALAQSPIRLEVSDANRE